MSTLTLGIVVILYMFVIAWLGYIGYKQTKNASDYLLGGRKVNPIIMALSYGATFISASPIIVEMYAHYAVLIIYGFFYRRR